jgi:hypothetical protein
MRTIAVYLTLLGLLLLSVAVGFLAADFPSWCGREHLCRAGWPAASDAASRQSSPAAVPHP